MGSRFGSRFASLTAYADHMRSAASSIRNPAPLAWAFYDFAYSLYSFILLVRFFPTWIINDHDRPDWYVSLTQVTVVLFLLLAMPLTGALADQHGRRKPFLIGFTVVSAVACTGLGFVPIDGNVLPALVVAGVAAAFGQLAFAQYDPLLADVAPEGQRGRVSGIAVALGFAGIIFGLVVVAELIVGDGSKQRAFAPAGLLYIALALPALVLVRERPRVAAPAGGPLVGRAFGQLAQSVRQARRYPRVSRFLAGRLLYSDAIATLSAFLAVYMDRLGGFSETEKNLAFGLSVLAAAVGAVLGGRLVEQVGPKRPLLAVLPAFAACVLLSALVGRPWTVWVAAPIAGGALGVVWTADRVFMLRLTPPELRGQFFAFFNLANRVASAIGPLLIWSGTVAILYQWTGWMSVLDASRVALAGLGAAAILGWIVIRPLSDEHGEEEVAVAAALV